VTTARRLFGATLVVLLGTLLLDRLELLHTAEFQLARQDTARPLWNAAIYVAAYFAVVLGITVALENMPADQYFTRLATDPPQFWGLTWVADYPAPQDFLGLLLGSGSSSNYGRWSDAGFDAAIEEAAAYDGGDEATQARLYDRAQAIVKDQVPVIPVAYPVGWALSRTGLLGASPAGVGTIRFAGLAWAR